MTASSAKPLLTRLGRGIRSDGLRTVADVDGVRRQPVSRSCCPTTALNHDKEILGAPLFSHGNLYTASPGCAWRARHELPENIRRSRVFFGFNLN